MQYILFLLSCTEYDLNRDDKVNDANTDSGENPDGSSIITDDECLVERHTRRRDWYWRLMQYRSRFFSAHC